MQGDNVARLWRRENDYMGWRKHQTEKEVRRLLEAGKGRLGVAANFFMGRLGVAANFFMGRLDTQYLNSTPLKPFTWLRYIDDYFLIWTHGLESLETFLQNLNCIFPVKFTWSFPREHITFMMWISGSRTIDLRQAFTSNLPTVCSISPFQQLPSIPYQTLFPIRSCCPALPHLLFS